MIIVVSYITVSKYGTRDFADVVKYLEMGYNPGGPIVIIQVLTRSVREWWKKRQWRDFDSTVLALKMEEEAMNQGI